MIVIISLTLGHELLGENIKQTYMYVAMYKLFRSRNTLSDMEQIWHIKPIVPFLLSLLSSRDMLDHTLILLKFYYMYFSSQRREIYKLP